MEKPTPAPAPPAPSPAAPPSTPIPVICDRCRAEGAAGVGDFAGLGALLDFEPVIRRGRVDGWSAERQRAFIAALAVTGSADRAAKAVGKSATGAQNLCQAEGAQGFADAWAAAKAIAFERGTLRLAESLRGVAPPQSNPVQPPPEPEVEPGEDPDLADAKELEWLESVVHKYLMKLRQEREARLSGAIVAADYYLRQLTWLEVVIDLGGGGGGFEFMTEFRLRGHWIGDIAETPAARLLDEARRDYWAEHGDPPRPQHPPRHLLSDHGGFCTEPLEYSDGGRQQSPEEQWQAYAEAHAQAAREQIEWEAEARQRSTEAKQDDA